ncbi:MAG: glycerol kinase GlpK [Myxococcota bacterium]|nr:glycerol kinase GlpK [Myxococcota bacterium]
MPPIIVTIDQGTTGSTVLLLGEDLRVRARGYRELPQIYPRPGWVEHDPEAIWRSVVEALGEALEQAQCDPSDIVGVGITNQRETTLCFDRQGRPLHNAIVWQDRRTAPACQALREAGREAWLRQRTGLLLDPYFSATKCQWLLDNVPGLRARAEGGEALFGTVDTFLIYRLSGGEAHVTDASNASRTLLFDLHECAFTPELCQLFGVPERALPRVVPSQGPCAWTRGVPGLPDGVPIAGIAGDQQAALFGQLCLQPGAAKCTYGTGAFLLLNIGSRAVLSEAGLITTVAWQRPGPGGTIETTYALEGSAFIAGAMVQWLRDGLQIIGSAAEVEALARSVPDSGGVVAVPALVGLGAPHWRPEARGLLCGLTRGTTRAHIARAVLEGIALQICDLAEAMSAAGQPLQVLRVDGGAAHNDLLMQLQADLLGVPIVRPELLETTAVGAGLLCGLGVGLWSQEQLQACWRVQRHFVPAMPPEQVREHRRRWAEAVQKA